MAAVGSRYELRPYQDKIVGDVVADFLAANERTEVVLAACPGAGKTLMGIDALARLIREGATTRALWSAHATAVLRSQTIEAFKKWQPDFTWAPYWPKGHPEHAPLDQIDAQVVIGLPQSLSSADVSGGQFDTEAELRTYAGNETGSMQTLLCGDCRIRESSHHGKEALLPLSVAEEAGALV